jgi:hypothetical protein
MFAKFTDRDTGTEVWINPTQVASIDAIAAAEGVTTIFMSNREEYRVALTPTEVVSSLHLASRGMVCP